MPKTGSSPYSYRDNGGQQHLVDSLAEVPARYRETATQVGTLGVEVKDAGDIVRDEATYRAAQAYNAADRGMHTLERAFYGVGWNARLHLPSLVVGSGLMLVIALAWSTVRPGAIRRLRRLVATLLVAAAVGGGYASWRAWGETLSAQQLANTAALMEKARAAVKQHERATP